jgi:lipopolysaccharide export system permease protein
LRTSGLNFWKIAKPAVCFAIIISVFVFWVNEKVVPQAEIISNQIRNDKMRSDFNLKQKNKPKIENLTFYGLKNRLFFIDRFDPNTNQLEGITIITHDNDQNIVEKIVAYKGEWTGIIWKFFKCNITEFNNSDIQSPVKVKVYDEKLMDIKETPDDFLRQRINVTSMNIRQLSDYIRKFSNSGAIKALNNLRVDLHQKIAFPWGIIAIVLVGVPFAMITGRRKAVTFTSLGIAVAIGFFYYVLNAVGLALGKGGILPPILSAWLTPIIFFGLAIYIIKTKF